MVIMVDEVGKEGALPVFAGRSAALRAEPASQSQAEPAAANAAITSLVMAVRGVWKNAMYRDDAGFPMAQALGLIEEHEVTEPCRTCGKPQPNYTYYKPSLAGQAYLALALASGIEAATAGETRSGSTEGESPVGAAETPKPTLHTPEQSS